MRYVSDESEPAEIRASDGERDAVAATLSTAVGKGQLTLAEFSTRLDAVYASKTRGELDRMVADLPAPEPDAAASAVATAEAPDPKPRPAWMVSIIGGLVRKGRWRVPARMISVSLIGGVDMDMREAQLTAPTVELVKVSVIGGVSLTVPRGVRVRVEGFTAIGGRDIKVDESAVHAGAPTVVVRAYCLIGGVAVKNG
jgi:hypothetical protein